MNEVIGFLRALGVEAKDAILDLAGLLKAEWAPGLVSLGIAAAFVILFAWYLGWVTRTRAALIDATAIVGRTSNDDNTREELIGIDAAFLEWATTKKGLRREIGAVWEEFRETTALDASDPNAISRNALRPSLYFNAEELRLSASGWRILPTLFVSIGLSLTFLGLIAALGDARSALETAGQNAAETQRALRDLIGTASAKFIMSLTGLFASILFSIGLRRGSSAIEGRIHALCVAIERRLSFVSLEQIMLDQLGELRQQKAQAQTLYTQLVAEIGRTLRDDAAPAIASHIAESMTPALSYIRSAGAEGAGDMARELSQKITSDIGDVLTAAGDRLAAAGDRLGDVAERMGVSTAGAGEAMDSAIARVAEAVAQLSERMTTTADATNAAFEQGSTRLLEAMNASLDRIRENTAAGAEALREAGGVMAQSGEAFRAEIAAAAGEARLAAAREMSSAAEAATADVAAAGAEATRAIDQLASVIGQRAVDAAERARVDLLAPLGDLSASLRETATNVERGVGAAARFAEATGRSAEATERAADGIGASADAIAGATGAVRLSLDRTTTTVTAATDAVRVSAESGQASAERTAAAVSAALEAALQTLSSERDAIRIVLEQMASTLRQFGELASRLDGIDEKLGDAFETYETRARQAMAEVRDHADKVHGHFAGALDALREVVDSVKEFEPQSGRR